MSGSRRLLPPLLISLVLLLSAACATRTPSPAPEAPVEE